MLEHKRNTKMSVQEFFELVESDPENRYEYVDGDIYMMTGGKPRRAMISNNLGRILGNLLQESPCMVYNSDACVQLSETRYVCPDVTVSCDPQDSDSGNDDEEEERYIHSPCLVVEVLSPGTKSRDRGEKFNLYQDCPTIQEYLLVDSQAPRVQLYRRESSELWTIHMLKLDGLVELHSLGVSFPVADIYAKTRFDLRRKR
ncbi:MAG TPA: Uma2 family endonuclease [Ktedonobacteraceae bacterium]|nr:Uma2 family endonuclease [Ktedonobacteraceae bacterium]